MAGVADHYMVEHFDFQKLASADEVAGNLDVGFARRRIPARVIVRKHKGGGVGHNGEAEHLQRVN